MKIDKNDIYNIIIESGIGGKAVCLHSSLRSFGNVTGGADAVIEAFLEAGCTLLAPSFTYDYQIPPLEEPKQNGREDDYKPSNNGKIYNPGINEIEPDMGAIPRAMVNTPGRRRGIHPTNSFVALGSDADELINSQTFEDVYAPFQKIMDKQGYIVMAGVDLTKMTAIHYAEQLSGRRLFIRWALDQTGDPVRIREGSCSEGFNRLLPFVADIEKQVNAGNSLWRIYPFNETVHAFTEAIRQDAGITHCSNQNCSCCNDIQKGGPI